MKSKRNKKRKNPGAIKTFIVKIQVPIFTNGPQNCLVYDRSRHFQCTLPYEGEIKKLIGDAVKIYCKVRFEGSRLVILGKAPAQDW